MSMTPYTSSNTPLTITQLLNLLDSDTLRVLSERLHTIAGAQTDADKAQMLFDFIDDCVTAEEEYNADHNRHVLAAKALDAVNLV